MVEKIQVGLSLIDPRKARQPYTEQMNYKDFLLKQRMGESDK